MQIIVILLLAVALALLVLGLIGSSPALVVASILASLVAVVAIARVRRRRLEAIRSASERPVAEPVEPAEPSMAELVATVAASKHAAGAADQDAVTVSELAAAGAAPTEPAPTVAAEQPVPTDDEEDPPAADTQAPLAEHGQNLVWVIDGRPRYHLITCDFLTGRSGEPIPLSQAVEDGFSPCGRCDPDNRLAPAEAG
ncbi:MAG TPA: hypothetical protein VH298_07125 [Jatrophihabitans sp.]|nr:hypothetical protein [Jatrophihabitans sp.]